jgi:hypothetical protein
VDEARPLSGELPELAGVAWRARVDDRRLRWLERRWTRWTAGHLVPFLATAIGLPLLSLVTLPLSVGACAFAWFIPALYAARGAGALQPPRRRPAVLGGPPAVAGAETRALGLLGDLVGHDARALVQRTGYVVEPGQLGTWVVGPEGALVVRGRGRRVTCWCVRATGEELPAADRVAHLLLALRADEVGFATVANLSFSGAPWRVRRGLRWPGAREALAAAVVSQRAAHGRARPRSGRGSAPAAA